MRIYNKLITALPHAASTGPRLSVIDSQVRTLCGGVYVCMYVCMCVCTCVCECVYSSRRGPLVPVGVSLQPVFFSIIQGFIELSYFWIAVCMIGLP